MTHVQAITSACWLVLNLVACAGGLEPSLGGDPSASGADSRASSADMGTPSFDSGASADSGAGADATPASGCPTTWRLSLAASVKDLHIDSSGTIFVASKVGARASVAAIDPCGTLRASRDFEVPGATSAVGTGITASGGKLYVAGNMVPREGGDPRDGFVAQVDPSTLAVDWTTRLTGSSGADEVWDIEALDGSLWVTGNANGPNTWIVKLPTTQATCGPPCGFSPFGGAGRRLFAANGKMYVGGRIPAPAPATLHEAFAVTFDSAARCDAPPCDFERDNSVIFTDAENGVSRNTEVRGMLVVGNDAYVAGFSYEDPNDLRGVVVRIDLRTAKATSYVLDQPGTKDGFVGIATDGTHIYAVGGQGWTDDMSKVQPVIVKLTMSDLKEVWKRTPPDKGFYNSVRVVGGNGLIIVGGDPAGVMRRCLTDGSC